MYISFISDHLFFLSQIRLLGLVLLGHHQLYLWYFKIADVEIIDNVDPAECKRQKGRDNYASLPEEEKEKRCAKAREGTILACVTLSCAVKGHS